MDVRAPKELLLLKTAAEVASRYACEKGGRLCGFRVETNSDTQFSYSIDSGKVAKSGLGSSAAVTVAAVAAILKFFGIDTSNKEVIHKLAQTSHSIATGKVGSGFDIAAATYGSIFYTRYSPEIIKGLPAEYTNQQLLELIENKWDCSIEPFELPDELGVLFANFVGESMITTSAVGSVSDFKRRFPDAYGTLMKELNFENLNAAKALRKIEKEDEGALYDFKAAFDIGRFLTKNLGRLAKVGIESDDCTELIEQSKKKGAFVSKLPGAGGKDAIAALALSENDRRGLARFWSGNKNLEIQDIKIDNKGVKN